jgi:hypothetical protein
VPGDDSSRVERLESIERGDPFAPALRGGLGKIGMNSVVDDVSADEQSDGWNMQASRLGCVRSSCIHRDKLVPFQLQFIVRERIGDREMLRYLTGEEFAPKVLQRRW